MALAGSNLERLPDLSEGRAIRQRDLMAEDPGKAANKWAKLMCANVQAVSESEGAATYTAYFMVEDEFHKQAHEYFTRELGLPDELDFDGSARFSYNNAVILRQALTYSEQDDSRLFGVYYTVSKGS